MTVNNYNSSEPGNEYRGRGGLLGGIPGPKTDLPRPGVGFGNTSPNDPPKAPLGFRCWLSAFQAI